MAEQTLPPAFAELEPFVELWAHATENARSERRWRSSKEEFQAFYDAVWPRLDEMLGCVDARPLSAMPGPEARLLYLLLAFAEIAPHVELYKGANQVPISFENSRMRPAHGDTVYA